MVAGLAVGEIRKCPGQGSASTGDGSASRHRVGFAAPSNRTVCGNCVCNSNAASSTHSEGWRGNPEFTGNCLRRLHRAIRCARLGRLDPRPTTPGAMERSQPRLAGVVLGAAQATWQGDRRQGGTLRGGGTAWRLAKALRGETRMIKIRKTNLECALESTASRFGLSTSQSRIRSRGERVAQDSLLKSCGLSRFSTKRQMPQVRKAGLALQEPWRALRMRQRNSKFAKRTWNVIWN